MPKEIERKFLVSYEDFEANMEPAPRAGVFLVQGYLSDYPNPTVRIRTVGGLMAFLTIKGPTDGITRDEYEYGIPHNEAKQMLEMCPKVISKTRHIKGRFEIDVFHGNLEGLIVAEIELESEDEEVEIPSWFGKEVSHDERFYNSNLINLKYEDLQDYA